MNERQERIERLAERWFAAQATDAEERELREWMRRAADVPESLREVRALFGGLDALAGERSPECWKPRRMRRMAPLSNMLKTRARWPSCRQLRGSDVLMTHRSLSVRLRSAGGPP